MPSPRRRRRFFALEGRFEVDDSGEAQGVIDPASSEPARLSPSAEVVDTSFHKAGIEARDDAEETDALAPSEDETIPPAFRLGRAPRSRAPQKRFFSPQLVVFSLGGLGLGLLLGYLLTRSAQGTVRFETAGNVQKEVKPLTQADQNDLDAAYAARHAHRYDDARQIFTALRLRHPGWEPMEIELDRTLFYEGKSNEASSALKAAVDKGNRPADANFLLALLDKARKSYAGAESCFEKAVAIDPTQPEYYFFWGECLREEGKLIDATTKFRSALLRNQYETANGLYRSKLWLCAIEADQGVSGGVTAQIDAALAEPLPPMEAFVAAAARDLKSGDLRAAADHLSRASQRADPIVFRYVLNDPVFAPLRAKPEFADFFRAPGSGGNQTADAAAGSPAPSPTP